jgi:AraC-like DNA-binding protein
MMTGISTQVRLRKMDSQDRSFRRTVVYQVSEGKMPLSVASVFSDPEDFQAALGKDGVLSLLVTGQGTFRARLTQIELNQIGLAAGEEELSRVAFVAMPADTLLVSFPLGDRPAPIWGGVQLRAGEIITLGPGQRIHARTDGPCRWGAIRLSGDDLAGYGRALTGAEFVVPPIARWRPPRAALRQLRHFHRAAIRAAEMRSRALADNEAAHGLEQQLIHALVECVSARSVDRETEATCRHRDILARFEDLVQDQPFLDIAEICGALGISERTLRRCCEEQLGMGSTEYVRRRRPELVGRP